MKDVFCKIVAGEIPSYKIYEDEKFYAFLDINPINLGHTLVIPKKHVEYIFDLDEDLYSELFLLVKRLSEPIRKATDAVRIGIAVEGFAVPHIHVHLVPLYKGNELNPELAHSEAADKLAKMAEKIQANLC